ncbi:MAG: topoisomerase DNA-binding C4 zinc finger domain-containing protein [Deltaproteobacteria bacterium]|nr:topoisomerase DNA-binding C4 zinc finger domain-containing protein [Deltaproteobacteria bacterium]
MYFMDFLETDFHKRRLPKRSIQLHSKDNLLVGLSLNKYSSFNRLMWETIIKNFDKSKFSSLQKGVYRADVPRNLLDVITLQTRKISEEQISEVLDKIAEKVEQAATLFPEDYERASSYAVDKASAILKKHLVIPFVQKLEQPLQTLSLGDENIAYLMEEELTAVLVQLMESAISETLKHAIAGEEIDAKDAIEKVMQTGDVRSDINSFFESFQVFDVYNEVYEMSRNKAILDKQDFYLYFCDITYNRAKYPIFYIPFTVEKSGDALAFDFDSQLYVNKKALEYITQQYNEERGKFGSLKTISERIIYLAQYGNDLSSTLQPIIDELTDFFELDSKVNVGKATPQVAKGLFTKITNSCYFALFDKSDESLVNDYEMILQLLAQGDSVLGAAFNRLIDDFINKNPERFTLEIEDEWDNMEVPDKLVFNSPIPLNSEQLQIIAAVRKKGCRYITVEGPPGTGKSHTITAIAFNAILDNQNVLVLSDKKEALDVVEDKITEAMNKVRIDKNFQNPILRLGKTGSTYSQILSSAAMNDIKLHHRAVKKEYEKLENSIDKISNTLKDELENEIARSGDIDLREVYEMIDLDQQYEGHNQPIDVEEVLKCPDAAGDLEEFRKIFLNLTELLNTPSIRQLLKLIKLEPTEMKDITGLLQVSQLANEIVDIVRYLRERYGARIDIVMKFELFSDAFMTTLSSFIIRYDRVFGILASLFMRGKIRQLDSDFKRSFPFNKFEQPRKSLKEIKEIWEMFHFASSTLKKQMTTPLPPDLDFSHVIHLIVKDEGVRNALDTMAGVLDDLKYIEARRPRYERTFKKIGFYPSSFDTYFDNGLTRIADNEIDLLLRYITLKQKTAKQFNALPIVNYANRKKAIEELVTVQMTYIMDGRVIDFFESNKADAQALREVIKKKVKFPQDKFLKLKEAFPCILSEIRDYAEYIPLEPEMFDLLIIDEASQVSIAQAFPALLRAKKVLILGDRKQFSNVKAAHARSETNTEYLNSLRDTFKRTISDSSDKLVRLENFNIKTSILDFFEFISNYSTQLMKYFRGYKEIISYSNRYFYRDTLQVMKIRGKSIDEVLVFSFINHDGKVEPVQNTNTLEINFIIKELQAFKADRCKNTIGIITPHTNQQKLLMENISALPEKDYFFDEMRLKIMTFDTCQGEERDIIYYSMVATETDDKLWGVFIKDLNSVDIEENGKIKAQRLNVGFSRARERMHFVLSKPLGQFNGSVGDALRHYHQILEDAKREKLVTMVDPKSAMEPYVLHWLYQTDFWNKSKQRTDFFPQFELGKYLKQLDKRYNHPEYKVDFLLIYLDESGKEHKIIIEYDGFHEHFKNIEGINELNYWRYYSDEDIYREKVLESYGYKFLRINRFNVGQNPIQTLDKRIASLVKPTNGNHEIVNDIHETIEGLSDGDMKECPKCKELRNIDEFKDKGLISGMGRICKVCKGKKNTRKHTPEKIPVTVSCPKCGHGMILRTGRRGKFYGCSRYPYCKGIRPAPTVDVMKPLSGRSTDLR